MKQTVTKIISYNALSLLQPTLKCNGLQATIAHMCSVWVVAIQNTPKARLGHVTSILNHVTVCVMYVCGWYGMGWEEIKVRIATDGVLIILSFCTHPS